MATASPTRDYDGTGDYLDTGDASTYNFTTADFTVVAWGYPDIITSWQTIMSNDEAGSVNGWGARTSSSGNGNMHLTKPSVGGANSSITTGTGAWKGLGYIVDNGTDVEFVHVTTTGTLTTDTVATANNCNSSTANARIGTEDANDFNGAINHVQVFSRLLTNTEVQNAIWAPGSITNGLVGYWPGYGQLSPEPDISTTGSDATVTGTGGIRNEACPAIPQQMPIT